MVNKNPTIKIMTPVTEVGKSNVHISMDDTSIKISHYDILFSQLYRVKIYLTREG